MKIVLLQSGPSHEVLVLTSFLIGLSKRYPKSQIIWVGEPDYFNLVKYNKRVSHTVNISGEITLENLPLVYKPDICVNTSFNSCAIKFVSTISPGRVYGLDKSGPVDQPAQFFFNVLQSKVKTNKTLLDIYYSVAGLKWKGEGYGLSYYPRSKQGKECGFFGNVPSDDCTRIRMPKNLLHRLDAINQYPDIRTDDHFVLHSAIALRKHVTFYSSDDLPYRIEYFKNGKTIVPKDKNIDSPNTST